MKEDIKNHGLIIPEIIEGDHYVLGGYTKLKGTVINPLGDWSKYLQVGERQNRGFFEPSSCSSHGTNRAVASLVLLKEGVEQNYTDRALAIGSGTIPGVGIDPHVVAEYARKTLGFGPESVLPFDDSIQTLEQFYSPKPLTKEIIAECTKFFNKYEFSHEWVFTSGSPIEKRAKLREALQLGPVCVAVYAWVRDDRGLYIKPKGARSNHWVQLVRYDNEDRPVIFDTYVEDDNTPYLKTLDPLYDFDIAKVYYIFPAGPKLSILAKIVSFLTEIVGLQKKLVERKLEPVIPIDENLPPPVPVSEYENPKGDFYRKDLSDAIEEYENAAKYLNNPGGLRESPYQNGSITQASTGKKLATFASYEIGKKALNHQIAIVCEGTSPAYNAEAKRMGLANCSLLTLAQFIRIYAPSSENDTEKYIAFVNKKTGIPKEWRMNNLV